METKNSKGKLVKIISMTLLIVMIICSFSFMCSIRFRLDYYVFGTLLNMKGYDYYDFDNFEEKKSDLEIIVNEVKLYIAQTPDFYSKYDIDSIYAKSSEGIHFIKKDVKFPNISYDIHKPNRNDWDKTINCLYGFPERGFDFIEVSEKYSDYVFFPCEEYSPRIIVYTGGKRPRKYINELWDKYKYVEVVKLAEGWYDIRPYDIKL